MRIGSLVWSQISARFRRRRASTALLIAALAVVVVLAGAGGAVSGNKVELLDGAAWLPSAIGQVVLVSGASAKPIAALGVGSNGDDLSVVQAGTTGYVVDRTAGHVTRVDGGTFDSSTPISFSSAEGAASLQVLVGGGKVFVLDGAKGVGYRVDPATLTPLGAPHPLDARVSTGSSVVDDRGWLWVIDAVTGAVKWLAGDQPVETGTVAAGPDSRLVLSGGSAVLIGKGGADWLSDEGSSAAHVDFGLRPNELAVASGTSDGRLLVVLAPRIVKICDRSNCDAAAYPLTGTSSRLGPAILLDGVILVPDLANGKVQLISVDTGNQIASPTILDPAADFDLFQWDTFLFYNDRKGERAGLLRLDGTYSGVEKYQRSNPELGLDEAAQDHTAPVIIPPTTSSEAPPTPPSDSTTTTPETITPDSGTTQPVVPEGGSGGGEGEGSGEAGGEGAASGGEPATVRLTVVASGPGQISTNLDKPPCRQDTCTYDIVPGSTAILTAAADGGNVLNWSPPESCSSNVCTLTMNSAVTRAALFSPPPPPGKVKLVVNATGNGRITNDFNGGDCSNTVCSYDVDENSVVTLTAVPEQPSNWPRWVDAPGCAGETCKITMDQRVVVSAPFHNDLTIAATGPGAVTVNSDSRTCRDSSCTYSIAPGATVSVRTAPDDSMVPASLSGQVSCSASNCTFTPEGPVRIEVAFKVRLTVSVAGPGSVTVTPAGGTCRSTTCDYTFPPNTRITLTSSPDNTWNPVSWNGPASCTANSCQLTLGSSALTQSASFGTDTVVVNVAIADGQGGRVTTDLGPACLTSCDYSVAAGTAVTFNGAAAINFGGPTWGAPCSANPCTFTATTSITVNVEFPRIIDRLIVTVGGGGRVVDSYTSQECRGRCETPIPRGTTMTLSALADSGHNLPAWGSRMQVTMNGPQGVSAVFAAQGGFVPGAELPSIGTGLIGTSAVCVENLDTNRWASFRGSSFQTTLNGSLAPGATDCTTLQGLWWGIPMIVTNTSSEANINAWLKW
jgi:Divergent InlB B-repeat domain